jgi:hypothetical protein
MNNWNLSVPKICHFYWGGANLVYLRYLTVKTFIKFNPDWDVVLWYPVKPYMGKSWGGTGHDLINSDLCKDYLPDLMDLEITKIPVDFEKMNFPGNTAEIHKADYMRIELLKQHGGVWSDLDIIYFKPLTDLKANTSENKDKEVYVCTGDYGHSTGFNMARPDSQFFNHLSDRLSAEYNPDNYQCWGPDLFNKYYKKVELIPGAVNLSMDVVYAHNCHNVNELLNGAAPRFNDESIGCHWYAGNQLWGKFLNETGGGVKNLQNNLISKIIRESE